MNTGPALTVINGHYDTLAAYINSTVQALDKAVADYVTYYAAYDSDFYSNVPVGLTEPDINMIVSNVTALNAALNSIPDSTAYSQSAEAYYGILAQIAREVPNLQRAGVVFTTGPTDILTSFGESIGQTASDKTEQETYQFFANIVTNNQHGDAIRAAVAEVLNQRLLNNAGILTYNDPEPRSVITQSQSQNVPISTYLSRNK